MEISGQYSDKVGRIEFRLPMITFEEEKIHFAYCPALDLTGYGNTPDEAKQSFEETLSEFFRYTINKDTFTSELTKLGWRVKKSNMKAPTLKEMINANDYLADIFENKEYKKFTQEVSFPAFA